MLYHLNEWREAALSPARAMAGLGQQMFSNPLSPLTYTRFGRSVAAGCEMVERGTRQYAKPEWFIDSTTVAGTEVPVEIETVLETDFCNLIHFKRHTDKRQPKLLLVAPLSGHYATLLRGTVKALIEDHDLYVTDWTDAREVPFYKGTFDLDDYIELVIRFLHHLGQGTHIMAVCQPSVPVLAAVSLMAADNDKCQPPTMTLMGGPIDTRRNPTKVNELATSRPLSWFERNVVTNVPVRYPGFLRRVYPGFLQISGFMSMNMDRHIGAHMKLFEHLVVGDGDSADSHKRFYDEYLSVMDLPAEYYLQTLDVVFQQHALPERTMVSRGREVDSLAIEKTALLTVEGELDDISGVGQTEAAHDICASLPARKRKHLLQKDVGHYGIFNGRRWREEIKPEVAAFIKKHD